MCILCEDLCLCAPSTYVISLLFFLLSVKVLDKSVIPAVYVLEAIASRSKTECPNVDTLGKFYVLLAPLCEEKKLRKTLHNTVTNLAMASPGKDAFVFVKSLLNQVSQYICMVIHIMKSMF